MVGSIIHTIAYSIIAVQELNLAYFYPSIFWNTASLIVDSSALEEDESEEIEPINGEEDSSEDEIEPEDDEEEGEIEVKRKKDKKTKKPVKYGKISTAIGKIRSYGIKIVPPDINRSSFTFVPEVEKNQIVYGLKGITRISDELAREIIEKRPFVSVEDFSLKIKLTKLQMINLIKCGALDTLTGLPRVEIMKDYLGEQAGCKKKLTLSNFAMLSKKNLVPLELKETEQIYWFNKELKQHKEDIYYILSEDDLLPFFNKHFSEDNTTIIQDSKVGIVQKTWDKIYKESMKKTKTFLSNPTTLDSLNNSLIQEIAKKYAEGTVSKWEMDSIGFYNEPHELSGISLGQYGVKNFFDLPEEPIVENSFQTRDGKTINMFKLERIAGTVIEKDKLKNIVTLLTKDGVVKVKIFKPQFIKYDRQIAVKNPETGKKTVMEKSWFSRGNKLIISGIRRDTNFFPKIYKSSEWDNPIGLIEKIDYQKDSLEIRFERFEV